ncbi:molybdate ABC transporter substrate-binding protein [Arthrobacter sp. AET 35A]|uniref:molybdate ABC transporter substrate-binding protein n=1 Tax=Arthrobacter sp. AET 35A TaxID=2292643 RepID=UPI0017852D06|nr:molybdate ABC transporter substrate-binding protein [Arthrobacter sp. AET 35A]MBE0010915.1 molybdate ABC transporter substrate-binding protein [Arthrobacter sp. AET 35A]
MRLPHGILAVLSLATVLGLTACGTSADTSEAADADQSLTVFAAASLQSTFTELGEQYEATHPGTTVTFSFAGSSDLATQLMAGAPADVFASADTLTMDRVAAEELIDGQPVPFATNTLTIGVPQGNPAGITSFEDLSDPGTRVVLCAPQVPCGAAAATAQEAAGITVNAVSEEASVTDTLGKIRSGEADAGLVYVTDVLAAGDSVEGIAFPEAMDALTTYPVAAVAGGNSEHAQGFIDLVTSPVGQQLLTDAGFGAP